MRPVERSLCMDIKWERREPRDEVSFHMLAEEGAFSLRQHIRVEGLVYEIVECSITSRVTVDGTSIWFVRAASVSDGSSQDTADGAALRRLRESLWPRRGVTISLALNPDNRMWMCVAAVEPRAEGIGATIAEAADKCRESLR